MARGYLLTGTCIAIVAGTQRTFSWGPFTAPIMIDSLTIRSQDTLNTRTSIGLFSAPSDDEVSGVAGPVIPAGWTNLLWPAQGTAGVADELLAMDLPLQGTSSTDWNTLPNLRLVVIGAQFWIKVIYFNRTGAGSTMHVYISCHDLTEEEAGTAIVVRPQPDFPVEILPAPPPPAILPPSPPPPAPAPPAPVGEPPPLPLPPPEAAPAIAIDPRDPDTSAEAQC